MKKTLFSLLFALIAVSMSGQMNFRPEIDWGGIKLEDNIVIGISFEIDSASFGGLSYEDRVDVDPELATDMDDAVERCVNSANSEMKAPFQSYQTIFFSAKTEGRKYHLHFIVKEVSQSGHTVADAILYTPDGMATFKNLHGKGGVYGSFVNLMGDGFESLGKLVAKEISKAKGRNKI